MEGCGGITFSVALDPKGGSHLLGEPDGKADTLGSRHQHANIRESGTGKIREIRTEARVLDGRLGEGHQQPLVVSALLCTETKRRSKLRSIPMVCPAGGYFWI